MDDRTIVFVADPTFGKLQAFWNDLIQFLNWCTFVIIGPLLQGIYWISMWGLKLILTYLAVFGVVWLGNTETSSTGKRRWIIYLPLLSALNLFGMVEWIMDYFPSLTQGEDAAVEAAVKAIAYCLREPVGQSNCSEVKWLNSWEIVRTNVSVFISWKVQKYRSYQQEVVQKLAEITSWCMLLFSTKWNSQGKLSYML